MGPFDGSADEDRPPNASISHANASISHATAINGDSSSSSGRSSGSSDSDSDTDEDAGGEDGGTPHVMQFTASTSLFTVQRQLHRTKHDLRNRLHSIAYDGEFIRHFAALFPALPCMANLRQGAWYVDPSLPSAAGTCCFKSSDGHNRQWSFNCRRLNLHVALAAAGHGGAVLVDSTRGGKRIPDAFSKTVPLWACVLNTAVARWRQQYCVATMCAPTPCQPEPELEPGPEPEHISELESRQNGGQEREWDMSLEEWDPTLHVATCISPSEKAQIADCIASWADELEAEAGGPRSGSPRHIIFGSASSLSISRGWRRCSGPIANLAQVLHRPLRALWFGADAGVSVVPEGYCKTLAMLPFTPLLCVTASETAHPKRGEFVYGQGARLRSPSHCDPRRVVAWALMASVSLLHVSDRRRSR